ncbi:hypothetical protein PORCRE_12 [Porphyromonas crevioricanis JCM 15906]|uniref:Uncharacterized protein n=1 Tax=Porphyromonas crevioricanis JCM 15906 TaxID=1305617 RepID=S4NAV8_9PORP|nr:hypothetical protein PORCRE_12 [Porphyromonas crevioricanis JCM 15906]
MGLGIRELFPRFFLLRARMKLYKLYRIDLVFPSPWRVSF